MILTTKYGLKIPEDTDPSDLRIFVGDNMTLLDAHTHLWEDITDKPTTFTPPLASVGVVGGARVGNGLAMSGEYMFVRTGDGIFIDANYAVSIDRTTVVSSDSTGGTGTATTLWTGTQLQYDEIVTKDANTLYYIVG